MSAGHDHPGPGIYRQGQTQQSRDLGDGLRARVEELEQRGGDPQLLEALALVEAEKHRPEQPNGIGCACGFCMWSVEHVVVMSIRAALRGDQ